MKLNKIFALAALVAGSLLAAPALTAQDSTNTPPAGAPPGGPGARRGPMTSDTIVRQLALTDEQKTKAKPIFDEMLQKMRALRQDTGLSQEDLNAKRKEIRDAVTAKLKEVPLTQEQLDKWAKMGAGQRRLGGAGGPPPAAGGDTAPKKN
jgi:Spy/CpxP family protein refolding chaperone